MVKNFWSLAPSSGQKWKSWFEWFWISKMYKNRNPSNNPNSPNQTAGHRQTVPSQYMFNMDESSITYWVLLIKMWPVWARLIVAPPARGHLEVTLSVFLDSGGSWSFFVQEIYIKSNVCLSRNTYVFEPSFSDIYFTGWFDFSFIFSVFSGLTAFISGIWYFLYSEKYLDLKELRKKYFRDN